MKALVIEDDQDVANYLVKGLKESDFVVDHAADGKEGMMMAASEDYDIMIVDRMLPGMDGLSIIKTVRATGNQVPVLILSALGDVDDRVEGLRGGGDDYLTKPFDFRELALRVEALARRPQLHTNTQVSEGHLTLDTRAKTVQWQQQPVTVTGVGFSILHKLLMEYPYPVSRSDLITHIWGDEPPESNALKSHMYSLRKALEKASGQPLLATISNIGYKLTGLDHEA